MRTLSVTLGSSSDGGMHDSLVDAVKYVNLVINAGTTIIDVGGESTRPGAMEVNVEKELQRVIPVAEAIAQHLEVWISVDTSRPKVIRESVKVGVHIINDIRSLPELGALEVATETGLPVCLIHMRRNPKTTQETPKYNDVSAEVNRCFTEQIARYEQAGVAKEKPLPDPGFGLDKSLSYNYSLLMRLAEFHHLNLPLLVGMSQKSMIGQLLNVGSSERLSGSLAYAAIAAMQGAYIICVHDVRETVEAMRVVEVILSAKKTNTMSGRECFDTDGIRGCVGNAPIIPNFVPKLGRAAGKVPTRHGSRKIVIGEDTRVSGYMLGSTPETGLAAADLSTFFTGPMPTPAVTYLTRTFRVEAGIVISASHNPLYDNGIRLLPTDGAKLSDAVEEVIKVEMEKETSCVDSVELSEAGRIVDTTGRYIEFCRAALSSEFSLSELKITVNCANGATYHITPNVLYELGANVIVTDCEPNGVDINAEMGATGVRALQARMLTERADPGIAFDGDGDRVVMTDREGNRVDGDQITYIIACEGLRQGQLRGGVVGTLMSNVGPELALKQLGIPFTRTEMGNHYIPEKMQEKGWRIGTENSGYMILLDKTTTGDGIIAGLQVLAVMTRNHMSLYNLYSDMEMFPQILVNVRYIVGSGDSLEHESVKAMITEVEAALGSRGRVLLRKSGTEPPIRMTVEGGNEAQMTELVRRIADTVEAA